MDAMTVRGLSFSYGSVRVLHEINIAIPQGRFAVLLGRNGAGKSTLLKLALGELFPDSAQGRIEILGQDVRPVSYTHLGDTLKIAYPTP